MIWVLVYKSAQISDSMSVFVEYLFTFHDDLDPDSVLVSIFIGIPAHKDALVHDISLVPGEHAVLDAGVRRHLGGRDKPVAIHGGQRIIEVPLQVRVSVSPTPQCERLSDHHT